MTYQKNITENLQIYSGGSETSFGHNPFVINDMVSPTNKVMSKAPFNTSFAHTNISECSLFPGSCDPFWKKAATLHEAHHPQLGTPGPYHLPAFCKDSGIVSLLRVPQGNSNGLLPGFVPVITISSR